MLSVKKKIANLIPIDVRDHLQNALTVEWENGNKTVLVDVTETGSQHIETEMSGIGVKGYGRLANDDEDSLTLLAESSQMSSQNSSAYNSKLLPALPRSQVQSYNFDETSLSNHNAHLGPNPFEGQPYPSPQTPASSAYAPSYHSTSTHALTSGNTDSSHFHIDTEGKRFVRHKTDNPWASFSTDDIDLLGDRDLIGDNGEKLDEPSKTGEGKSTNPFR
ncbi:uncharacterized protein L203_103248 [Cryptococcus depauperatus CBS 7841]|uniref:Uncharacterized protein n=1 Tax=Cryptococcus depauperatus CBS 7841 TaxID=1295531 RepID=A0A1E3HPG4_9TREE|nr:hypothetical protein L203_06136 [Cryptococcus depauperatus CBS 7841]